MDNAAEGAKEAGELDRNIGARVRSLRDARNLTLADLSARSGVSRAMLSRIERGESSPTAHLLNRVAGGLGITLSTLFADAQTPASPVSRRAAQAAWRDPESGYLRRAVSPSGTGSPAEIVDVEFPAGATVAFEAQRVAELDQHIFILDGRMELTLGGTMHRLETGDCLHMRLDQPVVFRNPAKKAARYIVVLCRGAPKP
jgi:transcriptional regulator with XRE-family HTH domain